ncbi:hypothetical protein PHPALM_28787 [Phytophthora palmivora]|uniref:Uncharacterized protein n=1 Tax=Phytophthora palmivora TaxID=4796 RepID=A0A2P4X969_9STRA|nr:hypothetical protein PHPALM_28787 [Phytophthora palmivora]
MRLSCNLIFVATTIIAASSNYVFAAGNEIPNSIYAGMSNLVLSATTIDNNQPTRLNVAYGKLATINKIYTQEEKKVGCRHQNEGVDARRVTVYLFRKNDIAYWVKLPTLSDGLVALQLRLKVTLGKMLSSKSD